MGRLVRSPHFGRIPGTVLASRAEVAASPGDDNTADGGPAARARLTVFLINPQTLKVISRPAFNIDVVAESGSLKIHGALENFPNSAIKAVRGVERDMFRLGKRMDASFKQRLVGINVSQSGNALLVQQPSFDGSSASAHRAKEFLLSRLLSVRSKALKQGVQFLARATAQPSKPADIAKTQLLPLVSEHQSNVCMRLKRDINRLDGHLARHSETKDKINRFSSFRVSQLNS